MHPVFEKVRDLVVVNSNHHALKLSLAMRDGPVGDIHKAYCGAHDAGYLYLYRHESVPEMVMETVVAPGQKDGITSVYKEHRIFESRSEILRTRAALIQAVAGAIGLSADAIGIEDPVRGRSLALTELSTGQLIDMLADRSRMGIVTMKTDNFVATTEVQA